MKKGKVKTSSTRGVILAFLFIFFVGTFGLTTVWLRQQIAVSAGATERMEKRLVEIERHEGRLTGEIAILLNPAYLEAQNRRFDLGLRRAEEDQVIYIDSRQQIRFAENRWNRLARSSEENNLTFYHAQGN